MEIKEGDTVIRFPMTRHKLKLISIHFQRRTDGRRAAYVRRTYGGRTADVIYNIELSSTLAGVGVHAPSDDFNEILIGCYD